MASVPCSRLLDDVVRMGVDATAGVVAIPHTLARCAAPACPAFRCPGASAGGHWPEMQIVTFESMYPRMAPDGDRIDL